MITTELQKIVSNTNNIERINNLLQIWMYDDYTKVLNDNDVNLINNVLLIIFYYGTLLKGLSITDKYPEVLLYLDKTYKNLEADLFVSKIFIELLSKIKIENTWLVNNKYIQYLLQKNNWNVSFKEWEIWDDNSWTYGYEFNLSIYLFMELYNTNFSLLSMWKEEIDKLIEIDTNIINIISKVNSFVFLLSKLNATGLINNLFMFNIKYIQTKIDKINFDNHNNLTPEIVTKINTWLNDIFKIHPSVFENLNKQWLNISSLNYKTLVSKNFLKNYMLKIITDEVPFFKNYIKWIKWNILQIVSEYHNKTKEKIEIEELWNKHTIYKIFSFNPNKQQEYSKIHNAFWLLQYLNMEQYIYTYILEKKILQGDIKDITLEIDLKIENTWLIEKRDKFFVIYKLYVNWEKVFEENN